MLEFGKGHTHAVTALGKMAGRTVAFIYTGKGDTCDTVSYTHLDVYKRQL